MSSATTSDNHLDFIDGLRGVAILLVMVCHWSHFVWGEAPRDGWFFTTLRGGHFGVTLFFLVSAYTLFSSSFRRFQREETPYRNFYLRRAFRILPLWWLATSFYVVLRHHSPVDHAPHYFMYYMFAKAPFLFGGEWSLFVEESFYLFLPLLFQLATTVRGTLILLAITVGVRVLSLAQGLSPLMPSVHWYCFALGILLFHAHRRAPQGFGSQIFALLALAAVIWSLRFDWGKGDPLAALSLCALFWAACDSKSFVGRAMRARWLRQFGICCYSLYLFHVAVIEWICLPLHRSLGASTFWGQLGVKTQFLISFPVFALSCLLISLVCFHVLEKPSIRLGKKFIEQLSGVRHALGTSP